MPKNWNKRWASKGGTQGNLDAFREPYNLSQRRIARYKGNARIMKDTVALHARIDAKIREEMVKFRKSINLEEGDNYEDYKPDVTG